MKAVPCLLCLALCAVADEAADRAAIERTIAALNRAPRPSALFTADASSELDRLANGKPVSFEPLLASEDPALHPTVTISHELWGEATINFPSVAAEILNPRIACDSIRFITPDVALADGNWTYENGPETQKKPLLFVMKKAGDDWKVASLRLLASSLSK